MASRENDIRALGAEIIWVMEQTAGNQPGTADNCYDFMSDPLIGATTGWCVGDSVTSPVAYAFDDSPFSIGRGFDIIVPRSTMNIEFVTSHGTPGGNENLSAQEVVDAVQAVVDGL